MKKTKETKKGLKEKIIEIVMKNVDIGEREIMIKEFLALFSNELSEYKKGIKSQLLQAKQEGIEELKKKVEEMDNKYYAGYFCIPEDDFIKLLEK